MRRASILLLGLLALAGCGGGGGKAASRTLSRGSASVSVVWPTARAVPENAALVEVVLTKQGSASASGKADLLKPLPNASVDNLFPGTYTVVARSYAESSFTKDANGVVTLASDAAPLSEGTTTISIAAGEDTTFAITMNTTLDHFKIEDFGATHAFSWSGMPSGNPTFYLGANGFRDKDDNPINLQYDVLRSAQIRVTPQSGSLKAASKVSDLLLLPVGGHAPVALTVTGGLQSADAGSTPSSFTQSVSYVPSATGTPTLRLDYSDYEDGGTPLLASFSGAVALKATVQSPTVTVATGLPKIFAAHPSDYRLVGTLTEGDLGSDKGAVYASTSSSSALSFTGVVNRARSYTASVSLQVKAVGGGYVEIGRLLDQAVDVAGNPSLDFSKGSYETIAVPTQPALEFKRGPGNSAKVTAILTTVGAQTVSFDPVLFTYLYDGTSPKTKLYPADLSLSGDGTSTWNVAASDNSRNRTTATGLKLGAIFLGGDPRLSAKTSPAADERPHNLAAFDVTIDANASGVNVGVH